MHSLALHFNPLIEEQPKKADSLALVGQRATRLGLEIAGITSIVDDLSALNAKQVEQVHEVILSAKEAGNTNKLLANSMEQARDSAEKAQKILNENADLFANTLANMISAMQTLSKGVFAVGEELGKVRSTIARIQEASDAIQSISKETQLIALNAGVEAARAGDAGRGFAVISKAMRSLADQIRNFANENQNSLTILQGTLQDLDSSARENVTTAQTAIAASSQASESTQKIQSLAASVFQLTQKITAMSDPVRRNIDSGIRVRDNLQSLVGLTKEADGNLTAALERAENILGISEAFMLFLFEAGMKTADSEFINLCQCAAQEVSDLFERSIASESISLAQLFDENYSPISHTDPQQYLTQFTDFMDRTLPQIQERIFKTNDRIVFACVFDRNGYLPTHNKIYCQPQGHDIAWNATYSRNRRLFNDRTGLAAAHNQKPFLWQIYQRQLGNEPPKLVIDVSAPIYLRNRHWGAFRLCFNAQF